MQTDAAYIALHSRRARLQQQQQQQQQIGMHESFNFEVLKLLKTLKMADSDNGLLLLVV